MAMNFGNSRNKTLENLSRMTEEVNTRLVREIPVDRIDENPENEYIFGYRDEDIARIAESIKKNGYIGAIDVIDLHNGRYEILSGHQRLRAVKMNGGQTIPCIVLDNDLTEAEKYSVVIASNVTNRHMSPLRWARSLQAYKENVLMKDPERKGRTRETLARVFGMGQTQVQRYEAILQMPEEIQQMCDDIDFPFHNFMYATIFTEEEKQELLEKILDYDRKKEDGAKISGNLILQFINSIRDRKKRADEAQELAHGIASSAEGAAPQTSAPAPEVPTPGYTAPVAVNPAPHGEPVHSSVPASDTAPAVPVMPVPAPAAEANVLLGDDFVSETGAAAAEREEEVPGESMKTPAIDRKVAIMSYDFDEISRSDFSVDDAPAVRNMLAKCKDAIAAIEEKLNSL